LGNRYRINGIPRYHHGREIILRYLRENLFEDNKIPTESELASMLGVSRSTVREALTYLEGEAVITKKQGVGSFVHPSVLHTKMRIDTMPASFVDLIEASGRKPELRQSRIELSKEPVPEDIQKSLRVTGETRIYRIDRVYFADGVPAVICNLFVRSDQQELMKNELEPNLVEFLSLLAGKEVTHAVVRLRALEPDDSIRSKFGLYRDQALIRWDELYYTIDDRPVCYSIVYFNPNIMELSLVRRLSVYPVL